MTCDLEREGRFSFGVDWNGVGATRQSRVRISRHEYSHASDERIFKGTRGRKLIQTREEPEQNSSAGPFGEKP